MDEAVDVERTRDLRDGKAEVLAHGGEQVAGDHALRSVISVRMSRLRKHCSFRLIE